MQLTDGTKIRTREAGWSGDFVTKLEESVLTDEQVRNLLALNIAEDRATKFLKIIEDNPDQPMLRLKLQFARPTTETGMRAQPGPNGLGMPEINISTYGHVPDQWPYENDTPLGSHPTPGSYAPGSYSIYDKSEVWADGVDVLYEQAIRERWVPATDIDWAALEKQPDDMERAICQLCTVVGQHALTIQKILASWEEKIAYGFHDVKIFIGTQIFDEGRKVEVLRKRALANGGGLGQMGLGTMYRAWFGSMKPTELFVAIDVLYKSYEIALFEKLAEVAPLAVDRDIFARLAKDSHRHLDFGLRHLKYYVQHHPNAREYLTHFLNRSESALSDEFYHSKVESESVAVILGGGVETISTGMERLRELREDQLRAYLLRLDSVAIDRLPAVNVGLLNLARGQATAGT
jgi:hypothetical protein